MAFWYYRLKDIHFLKLFFTLWQTISTDDWEKWENINLLNAFLVLRVNVFL